MAEFHLIDLVSQREAVRQHLKGRSAEEIVLWLASRGRLDCREVSGRPHYWFVSAAGREAVFFFHDGDLVFVGDHATFT